MPGDPKECRRERQVLPTDGGGLHIPLAKAQFEKIAQKWLLLAADLEHAKRDRRTVGCYRREEEGRMRTLPEPPPGWKSIHVAPADTDICICIQDGYGLYPLPFPCRKRTKAGSMRAKACHSTLSR